MKRIISVGVLLLVGVSIVSALNVTVGATYHTFFLKEFERYDSVDVGEIELLNRNLGDEVDFSITNVTASVGVFVDIDYAIVGAELGFPIPGAVWTGVSINGTVDEMQIIDTGYEVASLSFLYLNGHVLGKLPIRLGFVTLFPMAGMQYAYNLRYTDDGMDLKSVMTNSDDLNDWFALGGLGADFAIGNFVIRPSFLYAYNLTPGVQERGADFYSGQKIYVGVGFGYRL